MVDINMVAFAPGAGTGITTAEKSDLMFMDAIVGG